MATTNTNNPDCPNCNKSGLAILPVRYAVVPNSISATLPEPLGNKVKDVKLAHHRYALRTLRQGFVYLFYEKHARGSHIKWETYSVAANGTLWKQLSIAAISKVSSEPTCSRNGHNIPASVIAIERPEKCGKVWMAFSEHAWSMDTFKRFQGDAKARNRRMQVFEPAEWISDGGYRHGIAANEANLQHILEYKNRSAYAGISPDGAVPRISKDDGTFDTSMLQKETTRYPLHGRHEQAKDLATLMNKVGGDTSGKHNPPAIVALWDAVGITHELAGFAHEVVGWIEKCHSERELEVGAMHAIEGLKKSLLQRELAKDKQHEDAMSEHRRDLQRPVMSRADARNLREPQRSELLEVCDIIDRWDSKSPEYEVYKRPLMRANQQPEPERNRQINRICAEADQFVDKRAKERTARAEQIPSSVWKKYEDKIDMPVYEAFQRGYQELLSAADGILESRTSDLVSWLESPFLLDALTEFDDANQLDGEAFAEQVAELIYGMNGSGNGGEKLDAWVREEIGESNLLWRAVALNQNAVLLELKAAIAEAREHQTSRTLASTLDWVSYTSKTLKAFADTYKKFNTAHNANIAAAGTGGSKAFGAKIRPVNMRGIDKLAVTAGDRFFKAFSAPGLGDYASEKIIQHIFAIRAFVDPKDSAELIIVQAKNEGLARRQQLQRLRHARAFLAGDAPAIRTAQSEALGKAWAEFKTKNTGAGIALKDARLAVLVLLIEGVNFNKMLADSAMKGDAKSWWGLAASGLTITSTLFDVASVPAKALTGAESWSFQKVKLVGGLLGSAASAVGVLMDINDANKAYGRGGGLLSLVYAAKALAGLASSSLTIAASFTYAAPLIGRLSGKATISTAVRVVGTRAAAVIGFRIAFMTVGAWVTLVTFTLQVLAWTISKDALEEWCSLCAFGIERKSRDGYRVTKIQDMALEKAILEIGL